VSFNSNIKPQNFIPENRGSKIAVAEEEEQRYREKDRSDHSCFPGNKIKADERERERERERFCNEALTVTDFGAEEWLY
jgi:hypothetical protein